MVLYSSWLVKSDSACASAGATVNIRVLGRHMRSLAIFSVLSVLVIVLVLSFGFGLQLVVAEGPEECSREYSMPLTWDPVNPVDGATYYFGGYGGISATSKVHRMYIPQDGYIVSVQIYTRGATGGGSSEDVSVYIRINDATDYIVDTHRATEPFVNLSMNVPVSQGDYWEGKIECPTWVTNPGAWYSYGIMYLWQECPTPTPTPTSTSTPTPTPVTTGEYEFCGGEGYVVNSSGASYRTVRTPSQQSCIYANGSYWVFYENGLGNFSYVSSTDGEIWSSATVIESEDMPFSFGAMFDVAVNEQTDRVHFVCDPLKISPSNLSYLSGIACSNGTILWNEVNGSTRQVIIEQVGPYKLQDPVVELDSYGYPYVGVSYYYALAPNNGNITVLKSDNKDGVWSTEWSENVSYNDSTLLLPSITALSDGEMYVQYHMPFVEDNIVQGKVWDGVSWGVEENCSDLGLPLNGFSSHSEYWNGSNIHMVYTSTGFDLRHTYRNADGTWTPSEIVTPMYNGTSCGVLGEYRDTLSAYWIDFANETVCYSNYDEVSGWSSPFNWIENCNFYRTFTIQSMKHLGIGRFGVLYQVKDGSEYPVMMGKDNSCPGCPFNLSIISTGGTKAYLSWNSTPPVTNYIVRMRTDHYPDNASDGQQVYYGVNNSLVEVDGLALEWTTYYFSVFAEDGSDYGLCSAIGTVGGTIMYFGIIGMIALAITWFSSRRPEILLRLVASIMWLALMFWIVLGDTGFVLSDVWAGLIATACGVMAFVPWLWQMQTAIIKTRGNRSWTEYGEPPVFTPSRRREHARKLNRLTSARRQRRWRY